MLNNNKLRPFAILDKDILKQYVHLVLNKQLLEFGQEFSQVAFVMMDPFNHQFIV
jgi:hypothetical protein